MRSRTQRKRKGLALTKGGLDYIKTALAPPDFGIGTFSGIPDSYDGRVLTKSWTYTGGQPALTAGQNAYIVQLPTPGVAYWYGSIADAGTNLTLTPVYYSDMDTVFPSGIESSNVTNFRYAGQAMEVIPTVNAMTWTGQVQVFRGAIELSTVTLTSSSIGLVVNGLSPLINSSKPDAVHPFNLGCYCVSRQTQADHPFHNVVPGTIGSELNTGSFESGFTTSFQSTARIAGVGSMEAIIYKIPSYSATGNLFTIRTWATMEMQVSSASVLYEYTHMSPPHDPAALALVKKAFSEMQLCVPFYENEGLWSRVLDFLKRSASLLSHLPGPAGMVATGVGMAVEGIEALSL